MDTKNTGLYLIIIGAGIALISLLADVIGLGGDPTTIGWKQWLGAGGGVIVILVGSWMHFAAKKKELK